MPYRKYGGASFSSWQGIGAVLLIACPMSAVFPRMRCCASALVLTLSALAGAGGNAAGKGLPSKPNVLFIIADDLRDWTSWQGGHPQAHTPNMDRLAKMGMRFTNAHCNYALCNPSRTSLLTGMLPSSSGVYGNEQDWRRSVQVVGKQTLPEFFKASGYTTAAGGKIFHANHGGPQGRLSGWHGGRRGFEQDAAWTQRFPTAGVQLADLPVHTGQNFNGLDIWHWDWGGIDSPDGTTEDGQTVAWAADFLSQRQKKPFFLAVGLYKPHSPWYAPSPYFDERPVREVSVPDVRTDDLDDVPAFAKTHVKPGSYHDLITQKKLWKEAVRAYLANITFCDAMLGRLLDALEKSPQAKDTVVVFTSDHGWYLGEKQMWHKGKLWEEGTHIPLTIYAPGLTQPDSVSAQPVSLLDLYPTFCDLAHLKKPAHLDGESLLPLLKSPATPRTKPAVTAMGGGANVSYAARDARWRYIRYADGSEELYDHDADPHEWTNLAAQADTADVRSQLAAAFPTEWKSASRPAAELSIIAADNGITDLLMQPGDELTAAEAPDLTGNGLMLDAAFDYNPAVDLDSTLITQGDTALGYALHFVAGHPTLTVFFNQKPTAIRLDAIPEGPTHVRALIDGEGVMSLAIPDRGEILTESPFPLGFPGRPAAGLRAGQSFGLLNAQDYPNSTPFDGAVQRLRLTVLPSGHASAPAAPTPPQAAEPPAQVPQPPSPPPGQN